MPDLPAFQQSQLDFTAHIRNPESSPRPADVEERRMAIYRELLFNNVKGFIDSGFPVLKSLYPEQAWLKLVREFFGQHKCKTPYFSQIAEEFVGFLQNEHQPDRYDPPFLAQLAHYEWIELALMVSDLEIDENSISRNGDLLAAIPVVSPLATLQNYAWPVHQISAAQIPEMPAETPVYLIVYRDRKDKVGFIEANPVTARLFLLAQENEDQTGLDLINQIVQDLQHPNPELVRDGGYQTLLRLHHLDIVAGTRSV
ncbi:MAG: HvfC family RiPP maturation protein [Thiotrichales bacterium]